MMSDATTLLIITQSSSSSSSNINNIHHDDDNLTLLSNMLTNKFSNQQKGKTKWLLNRANQLHPSFKFKEYIPIEWMKDTQILTTLILNNRITRFNYFQLLPKIRVMNDKQVVLALLQKQIVTLEQVPEQFFNDREFMLEFFLGSPFYFGMYTRFERFYNDEDFNVELVRRDKVFLNRVSKGFKNSPSFKEKLTNKVDKYFAYELNGDTDDELRNNKDFVMHTMSFDSLALQFASDELKSDFEVVLKATTHYHRAVNYMSTKCYNDLDYFKRLFLKVPSVIEFAPIELIEDRETMLEVLRVDGLIIEHAPRRMKMDKEIVLIAVSQNPKAIQYVPHFHNDRDVQLLAHNFDYTYLQLASDSLRSDREFVFEIVKKQGMALEFAHHSLQSDKSLVREAVKSNERSFSFASSELRHDKEFVIDLVKAGYTLVMEFAVIDLNRNEALDLIKTDGLCLRFLTQFLPDEELENEAVKQNGFVISYSDALLEERMKSYYHGAYLF